MVTQSAKLPRPAMPMPSCARTELWAPSAPIRYWAHSSVRAQLGIGMAGRGSFADCVTIYFKADLRALINGRNLSVVYVNQPGLLAFFRFAITEDAGFLSLIHISEPTRQAEISYAVFCLKKK